MEGIDPRSLRSPIDLLTKVNSVKTRNPLIVTIKTGVTDSLYVYLVFTKKKRHVSRSPVKMVEENVLKFISHLTPLWLNLISVIRVVKLFTGIV